MPLEISQLHRHAAGWFAEHGQIIEAIRHRQAAGDWELAAQMLADSLFDLLMTGHNETIQAFLKAFPHGARSEYAELALVTPALELQKGRFADAAAHLEISERYAETLAAQRQPAFRVGIAALRLGLARRQGHLD